MTDFGGRKPWIIPASEDGGADLKLKLQKIREIATVTDDEIDIYYELGVNHSTWYKYKALYKSEFTDALEGGWHSTMTRIKQSMLKKALDGDYNAQRFVLERKNHWIDKSRHEHTGVDNKPIELIVRDYRDSGEGKNSNQEVSASVDTEEFQVEDAEE